MNATRIKICGIRDRESALVAAEAGASAIGLVFVERSPRYVTVDQAKTVIDALPAFVEPVALFVDAPPASIRAVVGKLGIRTVQLHGQETPSIAAELAPLRVIKAIGFTDGDEQACATVLRGWTRGPANVCAMLIDAPAKTPTVPGGTGETFDWQALRRLKDRGVCDDLPPLILAGGLSADNVKRAIEVVRPYGVDVSSGVESTRGVKDAGMIRKFCESIL